MIQKWDQKTSQNVKLERFPYPLNTVLELKQGYAMFVIVIVRKI